ncbi:MAG: HTTM domain-containing protein [Pirellulaceae bacterium]|nr:HTTM domain-containing protein [Pirellulaceae bacterium]
MTLAENAELRAQFPADDSSNRIVQMLRIWFGVDWRSLLAFRIGLGLLLIWDAASRLRDASAFYSSAGVLPRGLWLQEFSSRYPICLNLACDDVWFQYALLTVLIVSGLFITIGYRTTVSFAVAFILLGSLHTRNPQVLSLGDSLLRLLLFWSIFIPWGWVQSHTHTPRRETDDSFSDDAGAATLSPAVLALVLQVAGMYLITAIMKTGEAWHNGQALYYALHLDHMNYPWSKQLLNYPQLLQFLTTSTMVLEYSAPFLLLGLPFPRASRTIAVVLLIALHLGIIATIRIGIFPWVNLIALLPFVPGRVWQMCPATSWFSTPIKQFAKRFRSETTPIVVDRSRPASVLGIGPLALKQGAVLFFSFYVTWWNLSTLSPRYVMPASWRTVGTTLRLDQKWSMYAPDPSDFDGWYVMVATQADGRQFDPLQNGRAVVWDKPDDVGGMFDNFRWRKFMMKLVSRGNPKSLRASYADYFVRQWNRQATPTDQIQSLEIHFIVERTQPENQTTLRPRLIYRWTATSALKEFK